MPGNPRQPLSPPNAADAAAQVRWQPTKQQLSSPEGLAAAFKQLLTQHYALVDEHAATMDRLATAQRQLDRPPPPFPPGSGPVDSQLLGLPVAPVDAAQLANGALLRFDKPSGTFKFS
jgi:hypothetical protein